MVVVFNAGCTALKINAAVCIPHKMKQQVQKCRTSVIAPPPVLWSDITIQNGDASAEIVCVLQFAKFELVAAMQWAY